MDAQHLHRQEQHSDREQEHAHRRHEPPPLAGDVAPRELAGLECEQRERAGELAVEVQHAVEQVVADRGDGTVDVRRLAATVAVRAGQRGAAIAAGGGGVLSDVRRRRHPTRTPSRSS